MVNHVQVLQMAREGQHFYVEEEVFGMAIVSKEYMAFHWLSPC